MGCRLGANSRRPWVRSFSDIERRLRHRPRSTRRRAYASRGTGARAHNFLYPAPSLDDTITRLQAFEEAGADVLFAPGLPDLGAVRAVCAAVSKPVNFMVGIKGKSFSLAEFVEVGVRRISLATSLYRAAMTGLLDAAREVKDTGQFGFVERCVTTPELNKFMRI